MESSSGEAAAFVNLFVSHSFSKEAERLIQIDKRLRKGGRERERERKRFYWKKVKKNNLAV